MVVEVDMQPQIGLVGWADFGIEVGCDLCWRSNHVPDSEVFDVTLGREPCGASCSVVSAKLAMLGQARVS